VRRILDTRWPALLVGSACVGIALSVWLRPPAALPALVAFSAVVGALLASDRRRLAFAGGRARVRRAVVGNDPWRRARQELPRGPPGTRGFGAGGDHRPCAANVVCVACTGRSAPLRAHEHARARPPRAAAGTRAASGGRPRVASATLTGDPDRFERSVLRLALALLVVLRLLVVLLLRARVTESCFGAHRAIKRRSITSFDRDRAPLRGGSGGAKREGARQAGPLLSNAVRSS
jgi:hypothetical protein